MKTTKYGFALLLFASSLGGCSNSPSSESNTAASYYTQLGVGYLQKGRLDLASMNLEKALAQDSSSADTHHYYALLQEKLGQDGKAREHFRRALNLDGKNAALLNNYGSFQCRTGDYTGAEQSFLAAISDPLYPTPEFAYTNAGICVRKQGDTDKAESYFRKALQINPRFSETLYQMARLSYEKQDNTKAQAFLYRYNEAAPTNADALLLCYQIETALRETEKAEACALDLRTKFPDSTAATQIN
ncbi:MAG TPA: type IV pilus biogenesis/stability protein PilW [Candidatus Thiothrix moscowensis]|uniref:type IV pilus biogenesis/stability protein PilW n=1 Tax=unclassified Thiothrix TaxID=2636184 RepID=UPI0025D39D88|nr:MULTISPECIES: type IV pilus biogenesis/stability protein PilW [unclassified Thiothrix]HRJ52033.1 type IV pilus biogenesis/stability protein PilW [Candidatus Thiothrix moscowensis]HRJ92456.1 type IV pilus biogenesis/stability protein PilW [Candidatus Thiothrix moscowensis]